MSQATESKELTRNENGMLKGKKGIIFGVANDHSLAWACAKALYSEGAELAFTYQLKHSSVVSNRWQKVSAAICRNVRSRKR